MKKTPTQFKHYSANEIFLRLYGTNVSPKSMIESFDSVAIRFKSVHAAVILEDLGKTYTFFLPVKRRLGEWQAPLQDNQSDTMAFYASVMDKITKTTKSSHNSGIVEHFYRYCDDKKHWIILHRCVMETKDRTVTEKRSVGSMNIVLLNQGHIRNCQFEDVDHEIEQRNAVDFHDLIAVYAAYFDQMLRDLSFVPMEMIQAEWNKAVFKTQTSEILSSEGRFSLGLPWSEQSKGEVPTITLSLDLRKSTFAMQQARDRRYYAWWLETVSELAREITLAHGGIFDKFTGDGAICHFIYPTPDDCGNGRQAEDETVKAACACASDLIFAMQQHIANILPELKFQSEAFGPAIGIARDSAVWSLDRDGKPVVVGQGIVNACRLNGGRAGQILLTNDMKFQIDRLIPGIRFEKHELGGSHKEFPPPQEASCWRVHGRAVPAGSQASDIQDRVDRLWHEIKSRQDMCPTV